MKNSRLYGILGLACLYIYIVIPPCICIKILRKCSPCTSIPNRTISWNVIHYTDIVFILLCFLGTMVSKTT